METNEQEQQKPNVWPSRKFKLTVALMVIATAAFVFPPIINTIFGTNLIILTESGWITITSLLTGAYMGINVAQKVWAGDGKISINGGENDEEE
jgi:hypothetical protein